MEPDMGGDLSYEAPLTAQQSQPPQTQHPYARYVQPPAQPPQPPRPQAAQQARLLPGIDPAIGPIIRTSAAWLSRNEDAFIQQLHYAITRQIPDPAQASGMWAFCERMVRSLLWAVLSDQPPGVVTDMLHQVGAQNWIDGFPDTLYENVARAVAQTVHYLCVDEWSKSAASAWISYFMWIQPQLLAGAQQAAAQNGGAQQAAERRAAAQRAATEREAAAERAAAEREAARVKALARDSRGGHTQMVGDVNLESLASLLDDEDDENVGYSQIMVSMTWNSRRHPPQRTS
jgi:hypothetical protein